MPYFQRPQRPRPRRGWVGTKPASTPVILAGTIASPYVIYGGSLSQIAAAAGGTKGTDVAVEVILSFI